MKLYRGDRLENKDKIDGDVFFFSNFNIGRVIKNYARFYFFGDTKGVADQYCKEVTSVWEAGKPKLFDLDKRAGELSERFVHFFDDQVKVREESMQRYETMLEKHNIRMKTKREINAEKRELKEFVRKGPKAYIGKLVSKQNFSDNEDGLILKNFLLEEGYDGFTFTESRHGRTVGLIRRPKLLSVTAN